MDQMLPNLKTRWTSRVGHQVNYMPWFLRKTTVNIVNYCLKILRCQTIKRSFAKKDAKVGKAIRFWNARFQQIPLASVLLQSLSALRVISLASVLLWSISGAVDEPWGRRRLRHWRPSHHRQRASHADFSSTDVMLRSAFGLVHCYNLLPPHIVNIDEIMTRLNEKSEFLHKIKIYIYIYKGL